MSIARAHYSLRSIFARLDHAFFNIVISRGRHLSGRQASEISSCVLAVRALLVPAAERAKPASKTLGKVSCYVLIYDSL